MCNEQLINNFEYISYGDDHFHSDCVGDHMIKDWLIKNNWITDSNAMPKFIPEKSLELWEEKPIRYKGEDHGTMHANGEMSVHLDIKTGNLLKNMKQLIDMGTHYEIIV
jgi:hydroxylamine reductase (hybrid-cluster protein)